MPLICTGRRTVLIRFIHLIPHIFECALQRRRQWRRWQQWQRHRMTAAKSNDFYSGPSRMDGLLQYTYNTNSIYKWTCNREQHHIVWPTQITTTFDSGGPTHTHRHTAPSAHQLLDQPNSSFDRFFLFSKYFSHADRCVSAATHTRNTMCVPGSWRCAHKEAEDDTVRGGWTGGRLFLSHILSHSILQLDCDWMMMIHVDYYVLISYIHTCIHVCNIQYKYIW